MKITLEAKEIIRHQIEIDTNDYDVKEDDVFDIANFINEIKNDPKSFLQNHEGKYWDIVRNDQNEIEKVKLYETK